MADDGMVGLAGVASAVTSCRNVSPRTSKGVNWSRLAHPGESNTVSPGRAQSAAMATARSRVPASMMCSGSTPAEVKTATSVGAVEPIAITAANRAGSAAIDDRSTPLSAPPAMSTMCSKDRIAATAA